MAGLALALAVLHVAFVSLHLAMMAALLVSGDANAAQSRLGFVLCAPQRLPDAAALRNAAAQASEGESAQDTADATATFCSDCVCAVSAALILPDMPAPPYRVARAQDVPPVVRSTPLVLRPEARAKQSRAPPRSA